MIPACDSFSPAFCMVYSAYKLSKQADHIQPCCTSFPILNQSFVPCLVLTVASSLTYRFLRRREMWSGIPISKNFPQFVVIHTVNEVDVFSGIPSLSLWSNKCWQYLLLRLLWTKDSGATFPLSQANYKDGRSSSRPGLRITMEKEGGVLDTVGSFFKSYWDLLSAL